MVHTVRFVFRANIQYIIPGEYDHLCALLYDNLNWYIPYIIYLVIIGTDGSNKIDTPTTVDNMGVSTVYI